MPTEVLVPPLGQTVDVVKLVSWYRSEGDTVQQGEPLFVIETDKATLDVEAPASGTLRRVTAAPGDDVKALSAIALIAAPGEEVEAEVEIQAQAEVQSVPHSASASTLISASTSRRFVSPRARRLAEAEGAPLDAILPTGPEGAIIERDVRAYLAGVGEQGSGIRSHQRDAADQRERYPRRPPHRRGSRAGLARSGRAAARAGRSCERM